MSRRPLGASGLSVAPWSLGGNVFGWTADEARSFELLDAYVAAGGNLIDTADTYSRWVSGHAGGESESIIGRWLAERGRPRDLLIATKVGMEMAPGRKGLSRQHILDSIDGSLSRLGVDSIDLYQAHEDDPATPLLETLETFRDLIDRGKVRAIGASNYTAGRLAEALKVSETHGLPAYQSLQPRYNLMDRAEFEGELAATCRAHRLAVLTYSSLASGFLSGKYRAPADLAKSPRGRRAEARLTDRGHRILEAVDAVAATTRTAPATVALAWLMARPGVTSAIASVTSPGQFEQLRAATGLTLDPESVARLDRASA